MSRSNTPSPLSNDGLRYTAQELEILTQLSALDADNFVNHTDPVAAVPIIGRFRTMAHGILRNPHLPAPDPSIAACLRTERDEARAQNNVLQGQVCTLENERTPMMAEGARLTEQVTTLNETIQELQSDNNAYQEHIDALQNDLRHERENLVTLRNAVANAQPAPPPASFPVPDPERYDGNREKLPLFKSHLLMKLQGDDARFPTEQHKLRYTVGLLQGNAFAQVQPYILETTIDFTNVTALLNVLEAAFGDPDRTGTAERKLETLKQANRDFSTYYAEFSRHVANTQWNDAAKKTALSRSLSNEIKDALALADQVPEAYGEFASYLQRLDNRIRAREAERKGRPPPRAPAPKIPVVPVQSTASGTHPGPMDLSAFRPRLSPEERARRISQNMCLYCGGQGHVARFCPNKPRNPLRGNEAYFASAPAFSTPPASVTSSLPAYSRPPSPKPESAQSPVPKPAEN